MGVDKLTTVNEKYRPEREYSCWTRGWGKYFMNERKLIWAATARLRIHVGWGGLAFLNLAFDNPFLDIIQYNFVDVIHPSHMMTTF